MGKRIQIEELEIAEDNVGPPLQNIEKIKAFHESKNINAHHESQDCKAYQKPDKKAALF